MKKIYALCALSLLLSACGGLSSPKVGMMALVSEVKYTDENVEINNLGFGNGSKEGRACGQNILGIYASGDMSVEAAKKAGGISNITAVTTEVKNLIVMSNMCTVVRGN